MNGCDWNECSSIWHFNTHLDGFDIQRLPQWSMLNLHHFIQKISGSVQDIDFNSRREYQGVYLTSAVARIMWAKQSPLTMSHLPIASQQNMCFFFSCVRNVSPLNMQVDGPLQVQEILENQKEFADHCSLKPLERRRNLSQLKENARKFSIPWIRNPKK